MGISSLIHLIAACTRPSLITYNIHTDLEAINFYPRLSKKQLLKVPGKFSKVHMLCVGSVQDAKFSGIITITEVAGLF